MPNRRRKESLHAKRRKASPTSAGDVPPPKKGASARIKTVKLLEEAIKEHCRECGNCNGPDDGCEWGQRLECLKVDLENEPLGCWN